MKRPDGVTVIAIYHFLSAGLKLIGICAILMIPMSAILLFADLEGPELTIVTTVLAFGAFALAASGALSVIVGVGLMRMRSWARWLAIVLAVLMLLSIPVGTIIGIATLIYLLQDKVGKAFAEAEAPAAPRAPLPPTAPEPPQAEVELPEPDFEPSSEAEAMEEEG